MRRDLKTHQMRRESRHTLDEKGRHIR